MRKNLLIILSSPSGVGKSTIVRKLAFRDQNLQFSISKTTRKPRRDEVNGEDYFFVSQEEFDRLERESELVEFAKIFGDSYGTPKSFIRSCELQNLDVIFDINWRGAQQIMNSEFKSQVVSIFILPPSFEELKTRLTLRGTDTKEVIDYRMSKLNSELDHYDEYRYVVINNKLDEVVEQIQSIIVSERSLLTRRMEFMKGFVESLKTGE